MTKLNDEQINTYRADGLLSPLRVMSEAEASEFRQNMEDTEAEHGSMTGKYRSQKWHLLLTWLSELVHDPAILDPVESILGPDILCWGTSVLIKDPGDGTHVSWHQDLQYWGLEPDDVVSAWLALTPATKETGCMRMLAGSHTWTDLVHEDTDDDKNLLSRGQSIRDGIDEDTARILQLQPGEISLFHGNIAHASSSNSGTERRIGIVTRYLAPNVRQTKNADSAMLVRGQDTHGHFTLEAAPQADFDAAAQAEHDRIMNLRHAVLLDMQESA